MTSPLPPQSPLHLMHPIIPGVRDASGSVSTAIPAKFIAREGKAQVVCAGRQKKVVAELGGNIIVVVVTGSRSRSR